MVFVRLCAVGEKIELHLWRSGFLAGYPSERLWTHSEKDIVNNPRLIRQNQTEKIRDPPKNHPESRLGLQKSALEGKPDENSVARRLFVLHSGRKYIYIYNLIMICKRSLYFGSEWYMVLYLTWYYTSGREYDADSVGLFNDWLDFPASY